MEFIHDIFTLRIEADSDEGLDVNLYNSEDLKNTLIYLKLQPLWPVDTSFDDRTVIRDIPRDLFQIGEYYQSAVERHTTSKMYEGRSLLSVIHSILLKNNHSISRIVAIFSSSFNDYDEEIYFSLPAREFWKKQFLKKSTLPIEFFPEDLRYKLIINPVN